MNNISTKFLPFQFVWKQSYQNIWKYIRNEPLTMLQNSAVPDIVVQRFTKTFAIHAQSFLDNDHLSADIHLTHLFVLHSVNFFSNFRKFQRWKSKVWILPPQGLQVSTETHVWADIPRLVKWCKAALYLNRLRSKRMKNNIFCLLAQIAAGGWGLMCLLTQALSWNIQERILRKTTQIDSIWYLGIIPKDSSKHC